VGQGRTYRRAAGEKRQPRGGWFEAIVRSRRNTKGKSPRRRASHVSIAPPWAGKPVPRGTGFPARAFAAVFNKPRCAPRRHSGIATSRPISRTAPALLPSFRRSVPDKFPAPPPSRSSLSAPRWAAPSGPTPNPPSASPSAPPRPSGPAIAAARFRPETRSAKDAHDYRAAESERRDHAPSDQDEVCGLPSHPPGSPKTPSAKPAPSAPPPPRSAPRVRHPRPWHPRSRAPRRCTPPGSPAPTSSPPASASRAPDPHTTAPQPARFPPPDPLNGRAGPTASARSSKRPPSPRSDRETPSPNPAPGSCARASSPTGVIAKNRPPRAHGKRAGRWPPRRAVTAWCLKGSRRPFVQWVVTPKLGCQRRITARRNLLKLVHGPLAPGMPPLSPRNPKAAPSLPTALRAPRPPAPPTVRPAPHRPNHAPNLKSRSP
jgi:hypothetical protein